MKAITSPVIIEGVSTRKDGSLGLRLTTPELDSEAKLAFLELQNKNCKILIQPDTGMEGLKEVKGEFDKKSHSQRLRAVFFVYWKHLREINQCGLSFEQLYAQEMEKLIENVKAKLPGVN